MIHIRTTKIDAQGTSRAQLEPKHVMMLDIEPQAHSLSLLYPTAFKPAEPGIYLKNRCRPVLHKGQRYYTESSFKAQVPIKATLNALAPCREAVVDANGLIVIPVCIMQDQPRYLRDAPLVNLAAATTVRLGLEEYIEDSTYCNRASIENELESVLTDDGLRLWESESFNPIVSQLFQEVAEFIEEDRHRIYFLSLADTTLKIEKCGDWRVYMYYKHIEETQEVKENNDD